MVVWALEVSLLIIMEPTSVWSVGLSHCKELPYLLSPLHDITSHRETRP